MADAAVVHLPPLSGRQEVSWEALVEIAPTLSDDWLLIGGQMVFLHEVERGATDTRPTDDIDVVIDLRVEPDGLERVHQALVDASFDQSMPSPDGIAHRYRRAGATIDVVAPDNLGPRARLTLGSGRTIEAPGTSQALGRSESVDVVLTSGSTALVQRPTLVGGILGKVAAVTTNSRTVIGRASEAHARRRLARAPARSGRSRAGEPHP